MRQLERRAYRRQFDELIKTGQCKEFPDKELIAVLVPAVILTSIRRGKTGKKYQAVSVYKRGEVLHPTFRKGNVVMKIEEGLPAGIRQMMRHIPGSLVGRKGKDFVLAGDAQTLAAYAAKLNNIIRPLLKLFPSSQVLEEASREYLQILSFSEKHKSRLMELASKEINLAKEGKYWQKAAHIGTVLNLILEERARKYETAVRFWTLGKKWWDFYEETYRSFRNAYQRMGELIMEMEREKSESRKTTIAKELSGIYLHLTNLEGSYFNPFCKRVQSPEFQALAKVLTWADEGKWDKIERVAKRALAKIELLVKGEVPTLREIQRERELLSLEE